MSLILRAFRQTLIASAMISTAAVAATTPQQVGAKITLSRPTALKDAMAAYDTFKDQDIMATGTATKVCAKKGCWMTIKAETEEVRVTFKDYAFFVPFSTQGRPVKMQGRILRSEVSVADQRHLLEDAGAPAAELEKIKAPKTEFSFVASGVEIGG